MKRLFKGRAPKAALALVLACALALSCGAVAVAVGSDGGSGDEGGLSSLLPIKLKRGAFDVPGDDGVLADAEASLDAGRSQQAAGPTTLVIKLKSAPYRTVTFVEYWVDDAGAIETDSDGASRTHTYTQQVADARTTFPRDEAPEDRWLDGWFRADPADAGTTDASQLGERVDFANERITADVTFYGMLKKGYTTSLDQNLPAGATSVPLSAYVKRAESETDDVLAAPAVFASVPAPERKGYVFRGWYWPDLTTDGKTQLDPDNGGIKLKDRGANPVLSPEDSGKPAASGLTYRDVRDKTKGGTLYAKWELAPLVRIDLEDALKTGGEYASVWFWPERGFALERPVPDSEQTAGFVVDAAALEGGAIDATEKLGIVRNPQPGANRVFGGWGFEGTGDDGALKRSYVVSFERADGGASASSAYFLSPDILGLMGEDGQWAGPETRPDQTDAAVAYVVCPALADAARISVTAPFAVEFQKDGGAPFSQKELGLDGNTWIQSQPQQFANASKAGVGDDARDVAVYVSSIECTDVEASKIFPVKSEADQRALCLYDVSALEGYIGQAVLPADARSLRFGWSPAAGANKAYAQDDPAAWIVLPAAGAKELYFGLDLSKVSFDAQRLITGRPAESDGTFAYPARLANVKYTYSVAL